MRVKIYIDAEHIPAQKEMIFETEMPYLPQKGDLMGFWDNKGEWFIVTVDYFVHEFNEDGSFKITEINMTS